MASDAIQITRTQLYDLVWSEPISTVATRHGLSGRGFGKLCERAAVPVPSRGYWQKKAAGKPVTRVQLVEIAGDRDWTVTLPAIKNAEEAVACGVPHRDSLQALWDQLLNDARPVRVPMTLRRPHPLIAQTLDAEKRQWGKRPPHNPIEGRRRRLLSSLLVEMERQGFTFAPDQCVDGDIVASTGPDAVRFAIEERVRRQRVELLDEGATDADDRHTQWRSVKERTGELVARIRSPLPQGVLKKWKDGPHVPLEEQLHYVVVALIVAAACAKKEREERDAEDRRWEEEWLERQRQDEERKAEAARRKRLLEDARAWREAQDIRAYVAAVQESARPGAVDASDRGLAEWVNWALAAADAMDPIRTENKRGEERV